MNQAASTDIYLRHAGFLLGLFFDPEDRGDMWLRNGLLGVISQKELFIALRKFPGSPNCPTNIKHAGIYIYLTTNHLETVVQPSPETSCI
jgi:hypothetical protein